MTEKEEMRTENAMQWTVSDAKYVIEVMVDVPDVEDVEDGRDG